MKGMTYKDAYRESLKLLKQLDLENVKDTKVKSCSFDTQRRICLAMAFISSTKVYYFIYKSKVIINYNKFKNLILH